MIQNKHLRRSLEEGVSSKLSLFQLCDKLELLRHGKRPFVVAVVVQMEVFLRQGGELKEGTIQRVPDHCMALCIQIYK